MKTFIKCFFVLITWGTLFSQTNNVPVIENVRFIQHTDGTLLVDIYYDVLDADGNTLEIKVEASNDNGASWTLPCSTLSGDVGSGISSGQNKHVLWDFYADNPLISGYSFRIRITADDNKHTLFTSISPAGSGSISRNPDQYVFDHNETVTLTATANAGYLFDYWVGDVADSTNPKTLIMDSTKSVTAHFTQSGAHVIVTSPNGGENYDTNDTMPVRWDYSPDSGDSVWIDLYKGGQFYKRLNDGQDVGNDGDHDEHIADDIESGFDYRVRITSTADSSINDESDDNFTITQPTPAYITVTSPNGGETFNIDDTMPVRWNYSPDSGTRVWIDLYKGSQFYKRFKGGQDVANDGNHDEIITDDIQSGSDFRVRVTSTSNSSINDESDNNFIITQTAAAYITVASPNGGETFKVGDTMPIRWNHSPDSGDRVWIDLYKDGQFYKRLKNGQDVDNDGSHDEILTSEFQLDENYRVRITSTSNYSIRDESNQDFTIAQGPPYEIGSVTDIDGNIYKTVKIGTQWWMMENLKAEHYRNGESIPNITNAGEWKSLNNGAWCVYDNDETYADTYGYLYNWYAAIDIRNLAPTGWHVPTDDEWQILTDYLGGSATAGGMIKMTGTVGDGTGLWLSPNLGATNESGFSALPGGHRTSNGDFNNIKSYAIFWTSTEYTNYAWRRVLYYNDATISRTYIYKGMGFSVRCVKD